MSYGKKLNFPDSNLSSDDIEDFTYEFLLDLYSIFEIFVKDFNDIKKATEGLSEDASLNDNNPYIKVDKEKLKGSLLLYDLANKRVLLLFRQGYRLIFSFVRPGRVKIQFFKQKPLGEKEVFVDTFISAITSDAMSINWVHDNRKGFININVLARYYMRRFLQEI